MVLHFDGGYRTATECKFLEQVEDELAKFQNTCKDNSVLVFPPLDARYRYLIHQLVGLRSRLQTVSIGQGQQRRTVVYLVTGREISEMEQSPSDTQRTFFGRGRGRRTRRPDQPLYVPGALRQAKKREQQDDVSHIRDDISIVKTESSAINKQVLETKFSNSESKHTVDGSHEMGNSQPCTCVVSNNRTVENTLTSVNENCRTSNEKSLNDHESVTEQNHKTELKTSYKTNPLEELSFEQDGEQYNDLMVDERKLDDGKESKLTEDIKVKTDHSPEISLLDNSGCVGREKVGHGENCTESELVQVCCVNSEGSERLAMLGSDSLDPNGEQAENKANTHENSMQTAFSHEMTLECRTPNSGPEGLLSQTGQLLAKFDDLKTCGDDSSNQHTPAKRHNQGLIENVIIQHYEENTTVPDLTADQSKTAIKEETMKEEGLKTPQVMLSSSDIKIVTSDILDSTPSNDDRKLESQISDFGLMEVDSDKRVEESELPLKTTEKTIQAVSDETEGGSDSTFLDGNQNDDELQTELAKTSKKKKSKKDKSKEQKDDKTKSKERGEKKKKKEKKSVKTEKSDKEQVLDSEGKIKEGKKLKTKVLSTKKQNEKDLNTGFKECDNHNDGGDNGHDSDNWELNFDESGDCLNPECSEELSRRTGIENPEIHKTQFDYYSFTPKEVVLDDEEFGHIVEIYNFSSELKTQDLMQALSSFRSKGFDVKWVDDTHALGIFSSPIAAQEAIRLCSSPLMKLRPVSQGTPDSRRKATNCFEFLQPYKERPQTSTLLVDRLVTGALGMRSKMTREERVKEREKIKEAKDKKQQEKIQRAQIWGD